MDDCRAQIIDSYERHNELLRRHLGDLSMSDIKYAKYIGTLLASCELFLSAFNDMTYEPVRRDYADAMLCLKKLAAVIELIIQFWLLDLTLCDAMNDMKVLIQL